MSTFDEALRRNAAQRQEHQGQSAAKASREHQDAARAAAHLNQLVRDFTNALRGRVQPRTVIIRTDIKVGMVRRSNTDVPSVPGYILAYNKERLGFQQPTSASLITPEGRLWVAKPTRFKDKKTGNWRDRLEGAFVDITPETLLAGQVMLSAGVKLEDGRAVVSTGWTSWPVEDDLARRANELLTGTPAAWER